MGSPQLLPDDERAAANSRLNQRTFGLTNRIWIILLLLSFVLFFTRLIIPPAPPASPLAAHHAYNSANLRPRKYFQSRDANGNATDDGETDNPFPFCPQFGPGDKIGEDYGAHALLRTRVHLGSGARMQKVIHKAMSGLPVTISILGGSISACHGSGNDPISPLCYPSRFFTWWNTVFPHPASELTNGAMRRTNSAYYAYCHTHHIPDVTDLVILEFDTDDPNDKAWIEHFELLVRSILIRPDQPAIIVLGHFSPQLQQAHGYAGPEHLHSIVAQYYDVPHISIKPAVYDTYMSDPPSIRNELYVDPVLASPAGHEVIADVLISYIQSQTCAVWDAAMGHTIEGISPLLDALDKDKQPTDARGLFGGAGQRKGGAPEEEDASEAGVARDNKEDTPDDTAFASLVRVPAHLMSARPTDTRILPEVAPFCVSANDLINPLPPSLFSGSGWHAYHPPSPGGVHMASAAHYWYSTLPTSKLRVPLQIGAGDVAVYYMREPRSIVGEGSAVKCWVDDNYGGARLIENAADVGEPTPTLIVIDHYVALGSHFVECQLEGEEGKGVTPFKIIGVFAS